ncbi:MAG: sigma-54 dependent transcriptional regulator [Treponemataceae bacterium]
MKILIADDEPNIRDTLKRLLELEGIDAQCAANGEDARQLLEEGTFDLALLDLKMPRMSGQEVLDWIVTEGLGLPVIMISAHGEIADAVRALKAGAKDFLEKPFDTDELIRKVREIADEGRKLRTQEAAARTAAKQSGLIGEHPRIREIRNFIDRIAAVPTTVLITGESGTGKEVIAREIHDRSPRADEPFVAVNVGGLPDNLIESELFGFEKGAFTSAVSRKIGLCELAGSGTLFLDEIGEMPLQMQVKLLRVLQDKRFRRLGGTRDIPMGARVVSATNRDLEKEVREGRFREDLFYRLNVLRIEVPPLRDRKEDLPLLCQALLERVRDRVGLKQLSINPDALRKLERLPFPGNVRELENILERAAIYAQEGTIRADDIDTRFSEERQTSVANKHTEDTGNGVSLHEAEKELITAALERNGGNRTHTAQELGIGRRTLLYKLKDYGL